MTIPPHATPSEPSRHTAAIDTVKHGPQYGRLITKYAILAMYGLGYTIVSIPTITAVSGPWWAYAWAWLVLILSIVAIIGTVRGRNYNKHGLEIVATILLLALFVGYSAVIVFRAIAERDPAILPAALLPIALSVMPYAHLLDIARTGQGR